MVVIALLGAMTCSWAQSTTPAAPTTLDGWAERLQKFGKGIPQEQIFIHMDNTCYFLGDTLYYKAYVRRTDTGVPSKLSGVLYAELLNQDGYLVQRQQLEMKNGQVNGSFVLQDTLYGGYYELRAYTRWQLNWGETEHPHTEFAEEWFFNKRMAQEYYRDYEKLYSRVFPVYDKPQTPGDFVHEMTVRPLRRQFKADGQPLEGKVQLFPEGGHLVAGVPNQVAFEANDEEGMHIEGSVAILDASGAKVAEAKTEQRGRGTLTFTPKSGGNYTAQLTWKNGTAKQSLPKVETDGAAIQVTQKDGKVSIALANAGTAAQEELGMTVMNQGVMKHFSAIGSGATLSATVEATELPTGVNQITIFNAQGRIYADRLIFVRQPDFKAQNISFTGFDAKGAEPFSQVSLGVQGGQPGSTVSVAVRDAAHTEYIYDNGNILTEMLLSSQIRGFVENPGYFFEADDTEHQRALDLLLMIQGWRRFDWHTMATPGAFELNHMPEQTTPLLMGEVHNYHAQAQETQFDSDSASDVATGTTSNGKTEGEEEDAASVTNARKNTETTGKIQPDRAKDRRNRFVQGESGLKREVLVHARFNKPGADQFVDGEMMTENGRFSLQSPRFFEGAIFNVAASDSTKWSDSERDHYQWTLNNEDRNGMINYPEFYVRLRPFYPRFVKPYSFYQEHLAQAPKGSAMAQDWLNDGSRTLAEVTIGARRNGLRKFDASKPAFVIDAYQAFNDACDAGFCTGYFIGSGRFVQDVARTYIGDMNMDREYELDTRFGTKKITNISGYEQTKISVESAHSGIKNMPVEEFHVSDGDLEQYHHLANLGKVYIYTDYSPRREGDAHFENSNQPSVTVDLRLIENAGKRAAYRDRRYVLPGYSAPDEFYQPNYSTKPLPEVKDYRRTLYWNPDLQLDANGAAQIQFYNNGKQTQFAVSAEGMTPEGTLQTGISMPEQR